MSVLKRTLRQVAERCADTAARHLPTTRPRSAIIYYHSVHPTTPNSHRPAQFQAHLSWLKDRGYQSICMRDVPARVASADTQPWIAITFDDGYLDNHEVARPLLQEVGFVATIFVVAGLVGKTPRSSDQGHKLYPDRPMLDESALRELDAAGFEIASHGFTHRKASALALSNPDVYREELASSHARLSDIIGTSVTSYAYPNGQRGAFSEGTTELLRASPYRQAAITLWGRPTASSDLYALPRCIISEPDDTDEFAAKLTGARDYYWLYHRAFDLSRRW